MLRKELTLKNKGGLRLNTKMRTEIEKLKRIRMKITESYIKLGNFGWMKADSILREEIKKLEEITYKSGSAKQ